MKVPAGGSQRRVLSWRAFVAWSRELLWLRASWPGTTAGWQNLNRDLGACLSTCICQNQRPAHRRTRCLEGSNWLGRRRRLCIIPGCDAEASLWLHRAPVRVGQTFTRGDERRGHIVAESHAKRACSWIRDREGKGGGEACLYLCLCSCLCPRGRTVCSAIFVC